MRWGGGQPAVQIFTYNYRSPPPATGPGAEEKAKRTASPGWLGLWTTGKAKEGFF